MSTLRPAPSAIGSPIVIGKSYPTIPSIMKTKFDLFLQNVSNRALVYASKRLCL